MYIFRYVLLSVTTFTFIKQFLFVSKKYTSSQEQEPLYGMGLFHMDLEPLTHVGHMATSKQYLMVHSMRNKRLFAHGTNPGHQKFCPIV